MKSRAFPELLLSDLIRGLGRLSAYHDVLQTTVSEISTYCSISTIPIDPNYEQLPWVKADALRKFCQCALYIPSKVLKNMVLLSDIAGGLCSDNWSLKGVTVALPLRHFHSTKPPRFDQQVVVRLLLLLLEYGIVFKRDIVLYLLKLMEKLNIYSSYLTN